MTADAKSPNDAWSMYWRSGQSASCFFGPGAEVSFAAVWGDFADRFADGARLLDLAAGAGAAARLCAARATQRGVRLEIEAVDAADIGAAAASASIRFRSGVRLEQLPYPDAHFNGVLSQFGFEYADEAEAAREAVRVLAPGGAMRFVLHARDGAVHRDIAARLARLRGVLEQRGAATLVRNLTAAAAIGDQQTITREIAYLPAAEAQLNEIMRVAPPDDAALFYAREFLHDWSRRERYDAGELARAVEAGWRHACGVAERQEQMLRAARSEADIEALCARFAALGVATEPPRPHAAAGAQIAWLVDATKPAAL